MNPNSYLNQEAENTSPANLALNLMRVMDWTNPEGRIRDAYIPGWLRDACDDAIRTVPMEALQVEYNRNQHRYPIEMLERWQQATQSQWNQWKQISS